MRYELPGIFIDVEPWPDASGKRKSQTCKVRAEEVRAAWIGHHVVLGSQTRGGATARITEPTQRKQRFVYGREMVQPEKENAKMPFFFRRKGPHARTEERSGGMYTWEHPREDPFWTPKTPPAKVDFGPTGRTHADVRPGKRRGRI